MILFTNGRNGRLTEATIQKIVAQAAKRSGLNVHPHTLRHSFATHLLEMEWISDISELLGHAKLRDDADIYHVANKNLRY